MTERCLIIAEAGVNHNGRLDLALKLCDAAKSSGADVVKFQTWNTEKLITRTVGQAEYQTENTGKRESQFDMLKRLELSYDDFRTIKAYCDEIGIVFASTADEPDSLDFLVDLGIPFIKVGSGEIGNVSYLRYMGEKKLPVVLSTGMSTLKDVEMSVEALKQGGAGEISLLHCTTAYPCPIRSVNLKAMYTLRDRFHCPVGYSDHTNGSVVAVAAVAMGATIIEKHFTLDRSMEGPDHVASTEPDEFRKMVDDIRDVEACLGTGEKCPTEEERVISGVVRKRIVAKKQIHVGDFFSSDNICVKRNETGREAREWDEVIGIMSDREYAPDEGIV